MPYRTRLSACGRIGAYMTSSDDTANAVRAKLSTYTDPYLAQTLRQAQAIEAVSLQDGVANIELKFGFPCADYAAELQPALQSYLEPVLGGARVESHAQGAYYRARSAAHAQTARQRQKRHRGGLGEGGGGQVDHGRQPGPRLGGARCARGSIGCGYLRAQPAANDGPRRPQAAKHAMASTSHPCGCTGSRSCRSAS